MEGTSPGFYVQQEGVGIEYFLVYLERQLGEKEALDFQFYADVAFDGDLSSLES